MIDSLGHFELVTDSNNKFIFSSIGPVAVIFVSACMHGSLFFKRFLT